MQRRPCNKFVQCLALAMVIGCFDSPKVGLSNVRASEWAATRTNKSSDAIANGNNSCERAGSTRPDPLRGRVGSCPNNEVAKTPVATKK